MLENHQSAKDRWGGASDIIDRWLQERQELLIGFCALSEAPGSADAAKKLQRTCQILVDYISAGHFEIYNALIKEGQDFENQAALDEARGLVGTIDQTTEQILDFNDKYLATDDLDTLVIDLSQLGEALAIRFDAEDRMIEVLHTAHKDLAGRA